MCIPRDPSHRLANRVSNIPNLTAYSIRQSTLLYHSCRSSSTPNPCTLHSSIQPPLAVTMLLGSLFPRDRPSSVIASLP
jgi:hypothetical protein